MNDNAPHTHSTPGCLHCHLMTQIRDFMKATYPDARGTQFLDYTVTALVLAIEQMVSLHPDPAIQRSAWAILFAKAIEQVAAAENATCASAGTKH